MLETTTVCVGVLLQQSLQTLLEDQFLDDITKVKLGRRSCKLVTMKDLSRLYRNSDDRVVLDGSALDWRAKLRADVDKRDEAREEDVFVCNESTFCDFMQHGEIGGM